MTSFEIVTTIKAPPDRCFDLARSIDLHVDSTSETAEKAVAGVTSGLISLGESVTWEATHFGLRQNLTSVVTALDRPRSFRDEMTEGPFGSFVHDHVFALFGDVTTMTDAIQFAAPIWAMGVLGERLLLAGYLERFIARRGEIIKSVAETEEWKKYLA